MKPPIDAVAAPPRAHASSPAPLSTEPFAPVTIDELRAAVWGPVTSERRSDFDLNPSARAVADRGGLRPAAVLCGVVERANGLMVILTERAAHLKRHAGQIAFPGGKVDAEDPSPRAAALREADEEIGLYAGQVDVFGAIDPYETSTGFLVTPFVAMVDPRFQPIADAREVADVFEAPLGFLMDPANHRRESRVWRGARREYLAMPYGERYIWGATAGMLKSLSDRILRARAGG